MKQSARIAGTALVLLLAGHGSAFAGDRGDRAEARLDRAGNRIERRLEHRGERIDRRLDARALAADAAGRDGLAHRLDRRGDIVERRLERKGERIDARLDRLGHGIDRRID